MSISAGLGQGCIPISDADWDAFVNEVTGVPKTFALAETQAPSATVELGKLHAPEKKRLNPRDISALQSKAEILSVAWGEFQSQNFSWPMRLERAERGETPEKRAADTKLLELSLKLISRVNEWACKEGLTQIPNERTPISDDLILTPRFKPVQIAGTKWSQITA